MLRVIQMAMIDGPIRMSDQIKLEAGKLYKTRIGMRAIVDELLYDLGTPRALGQIYSYRRGTVITHPWTWTMDGSVLKDHLKGYESENDLVAEWGDPAKLSTRELANRFCSSLDFYNPCDQTEAENDLEILLIAAKNTAATEEREMWITKFKHWVFCAKDAPGTQQYIKALGFQDCVISMESNDRWIPSAAYRTRENTPTLIDHSTSKSERKSFTDGRNAALEAAAEFVSACSIKLGGIPNCEFMLSKLGDAIRTLKVEGPGDKDE